MCKLVQMMPKYTNICTLLQLMSKNYNQVQIIVNDAKISNFKLLQIIANTCKLLQILACTLLQKRI